MHKTDFKAFQDKMREAGDETRYACMSRPYLRKQPVPEIAPEKALIAHQAETLQIKSLREKHFSKQRQRREDMRT